VLEADAGRPARDFRGQATANGEAFMNKTGLHGKLISQRSINLNSFAQVFPSDPSRSQNGKSRASFGLSGEP
jgi:hypothetical protein